MNKRKRNDEMIMECYKELYNSSTPKVDFDVLLENAPINEHGQKEIDYMNYTIDINVYDGIVNKIIKKYKLTKIEIEQFKNSIALGCSPKFK